MSMPAACLRVRSAHGAAPPCGLPPLDGLCHALAVPPPLPSLPPSLPQSVILRNSLFPIAISPPSSPHSNASNLDLPCPRCLGEIRTDSVAAAGRSVSACSEAATFAPHWPLSHSPPSFMIFFGVEVDLPRVTEWEQCNPQIRQIRGE